MKNWMRWMAVMAGLVMPAGAAELAPVEILAMVWRNADYLSEGEKAGLDEAARAGRRAAGKGLLELTPGPGMEREIAAMLPVLTGPIEGRMAGLRPEQRERLEADWSATVGRPGRPGGMAVGGRQWQRMGTALELNMTQMMALGKMAMEMRAEMPALMGNVRAALDGYGRVVIRGGETGIQGRALARAMADLAAAGVARRDAFLATLEPGQRARAKAMMMEMRTAVLAGGGF